MDPPFLRELWIVLLSLEAFLIIVCNIIGLVIFVRKYRHLRTNILLINLSIADLLAGMFIVKILIIYVTKAPVNNVVNCNGRDLLSILTDFSHQGALESLATLALIAIERAFAVLKPLRHRVLKRKYYRYGVLLTWCLTSIPTVMTLAMRCNSSTINMVFAVSFVQVMLSIAVMIVSYAAIYIKLRFYPVFQHNANRQIQMKLLKTVFIATVASTGTMLPFCGYYAYFVTCKRCEFDDNVYSATLLLAFSNSFINFLVYAWKMPDFGKEVTKLTCFCLKTNPFNEVHTTTRETHAAPKTVEQLYSNRVFDVNAASSDMIG